jgi:hypothetical protein
MCLPGASLILATRMMSGRVGRSLPAQRLRAPIRDAFTIDTSRWRPSRQRQR